LTLTKGRRNRENKVFESNGEVNEGSYLERGLAPPVSRNSERPPYQPEEGKPLKKGRGPKSNQKPKGCIQEGKKVNLFLDKLSTSREGGESSMHSQGTKASQEGEGAKPPGKSAGRKFVTNERKNTGGGLEIRKYLLKKQMPGMFQEKNKK